MSSTKSSNFCDVTIKDDKILLVSDNLANVTQLKIYESKIKYLSYWLC